MAQSSGIGKSSLQEGHFTRGERTEAETVVELDENEKHGNQQDQHGNEGVVHVGERIPKDPPLQAEHHWNVMLIESDSEQISPDPVSHPGDPLLIGDPAKHPDHEDPRQHGDKRQSPDRGQHAKRPEQDGKDHFHRLVDEVHECRHSVSANCPAVAA